jgi:hypothetical protein
MMKKYSAIWDLCKKHLRKGRAVDFVHTRISLDFALQLLDKLGGDPDIVVPAIMLHDIGFAVIESEDLEQKTINPETASSKKAYSSVLREAHLVEGKKLAENILKEVEYPEALIAPIVEIVGDHEDLLGRAPSDRNNRNKVIVSDADKLYRYCPHGFSSMTRIHKASEEELFSNLLHKMDDWLITDYAKRIAFDELRKVPNSERLSQLMEIEV